WTADLMNGPDVGGRACHLAGIIDDHSRFLTGHQFVRRPDAIRFAAVLRSAVECYGIPATLYADNGGCFTDSSLARTCAVLGIKLTHSQPGKPAGRGKIEKVFQTIQQQFLVEVTAGTGDPARRPVTSLDELNDLLDHWVREVYHRRVHTETGEGPRARYEAAGPAVPPDAALPPEAFAWSAVRLVRKTATVALEGNQYSVDPFLVGRKVELVFDPFDMTQLTVYWAGRPADRGQPRRRHHPRAPAVRPRRPGPPQYHPGHRRDHHRQPLTGTENPMIEILQAHWGFTTMPFTAAIPVPGLFGSAAHNEAVARLRWLISARGLGVLTGEVGCGKTVAVRAAADGLDGSRHTLI